MAKTPEFFETAFAPVKSVNELTLKGAEKMFEANVATLRKQSDFALKAWRAALDVQDLEGAKAYFSAQGDAAKEVVEDLVSDAKVMAEIGQDYIADLRKVFEDNVSALAKKAA